MILKSIRMQAELAIEEADVIVFMCDAKTGVTQSDEEVAQILFRSGKPVILSVNKVDNLKRVDDIYEFYSLGFGDPVGISGSHGTGIGDLLDVVVENLPELEDDGYDEDVIRVALIGRPNVGKSSLVNAILGEERVIVSDVAGTTRDAIDTPFEKDGRGMCSSIRRACANAGKCMRPRRNTVSCAPCVPSSVRMSFSSSSTGKKASSSRTSILPVMPMRPVKPLCSL